ncbi:MAG: ABC transporter substrate-binding protein [Candidatus Thermoplasmatota archaeon]|jgi:peptide/nickel transport system substrate-binding protein|nr:ABC transporter substrate-binding protein [Candidatus Thermoplasmatota archaeon]
MTIISSKRKIAVAIALIMVLSGFVVFGGHSSDVHSSTATNAATASNQSTLYLSPGPTAAFVDNFNPFNVWTTPAGIMGFIFEPLFQINTYNGTVLPWLGTSYKFSPNGMYLNITLRHNVTYSNGAPFNSYDVVYTFNLEKKALGSWPVVSNITALGPYEVSFKFTSPQTEYLFYIGSQVIFPVNETWENATSNGVPDPQSQIVTNPIGTGPYMLQSFSPQKIVLTKNPHYWQPNEPKIANVVYVDYTSNSALALALAEGKVEWASVFEPNVTQLFTANNPAHNKYWYPPGQQTTIVLNNLIYPLNQTFFRVALSVAINRTAIDNIGEYGYEAPANGANILQQQMTYLNASNANLANKYAEYNVSLALSILSAHGFTLNSKGQLTAPNGTIVPDLNLMSVAGYSDWDTDITIIAKDLKSIGLTVTTTTPTASVIESDISDGNYQMALDTVTGVGPTPYYDYGGFIGKVLPIGNTSYINEERWNYSSTNFMTYYNNYTETGNLTYQGNDINHMVTIVTEQMPMIPLVYSAQWYEYVNTSIGGWPNASNPYWIPVPWYPGPSEVVLLHLYPLNTPAATNKGISPLTYDYIAVGVVVAVVAIGSVLYLNNKKQKRKND